MSDNTNTTLGKDVEIEIDHATDKAGSDKCLKAFKMDEAKQEVLTDSFSENPAIKTEECEKCSSEHEIDTHHVLLNKCECLYPVSTCGFITKELTSYQRKDVLDNWNCFSLLTNAFTHLNNHLLIYYTQDEYSDECYLQLAVKIQATYLTMGEGRANGLQSAKQIASRNAVQMILENRLPTKDNYEIEEWVKCDIEKNIQETEFASNLKSNSDVSVNIEEDDVLVEVSSSWFMHRVRICLITIVKDMLLNCNSVPSDLQQKRNIGVNCSIDKMQYSQEFNQPEQTMEVDEDENIEVIELVPQSSEPNSESSYIENIYSNISHARYRLPTDDIVMESEEDSDFNENEINQLLVDKSDEDVIVLEQIVKDEKNAEVTVACIYSVNDLNNSPLSGSNLKEVFLKAESEENEDLKNDVEMQIISTKYSNKIYPSSIASTSKVSSKIRRDYFSSNDGNIFEIWSCPFFVQRAFKISKISLMENYTHDCKETSVIKCTLRAEIGKETWILRVGEGKTAKEAKWNAFLLTLLMVLENDSPIQKDTVTDVDKNLDLCSQEEKRIPDDNVGSKMLKLMGWTGGGLGKTGEGIKEPVQVARIYGRAGIGSHKGENCLPAIYENQIRRSVVNIIRCFINSKTTNVNKSNLKPSKRHMNIREITEKEIINQVESFLENTTPKQECKEDKMTRKANRAARKEKRAKIKQRQRSKRIRKKKNKEVIQPQVDDTPENSKKKKDFQNCAVINQGSSNTSIFCDINISLVNETERCCAAFLKDHPSTLFLVIEKYETSLTKWDQIIANSLSYCSGKWKIRFPSIHCGNEFECSVMIKRDCMSHWIPLGRGIGKTAKVARKQVSEKIIIALLQESYLIIVKKAVCGRMITVDDLVDNTSGLNIEQTKSSSLCGVGKEESLKAIQIVPERPTKDILHTPDFKEKVHYLIEEMVTKRVQEELVPDLVFSSELSSNLKKFINKYIKKKNYTKFVGAKQQSLEGKNYVLVSPMIDSSSLCQKICAGGGKTEKYDIFEPGVINIEKLIKM